MSTTDDFVGKNCPHCGAIDSLQADEALGEVACTECALIVAMGLEENTLTRYNQDATYDDVDRHRERDEINNNISNNISNNNNNSNNNNTSGGLSTAKITLHPAMLNCIRSLQKKSTAPEQVIGRAVEIAKRFVAGRRARGQRLEKQQDVAAACFMFAAEQLNHPIPLAELRCLDASLGDVEYRRAEIVKELQLETEERQLKSMFADNLLTSYLLRLGLQVSLYMPHCKKLLEAMQHVDGISSMGIVDKIIIALLLARTSRSFNWEGKPSAIFSNNNNNTSSGSGSNNNNNNSNGKLSIETIYANFAAKAHLDAGKVKKIMQTATDNLRDIVKAFEALDSTVKNEIENSDATPSMKRMKVEKEV